MGRRQQQQGTAVSPPSALPSPLAAPWPSSPPLSSTAASEEAQRGGVHSLTCRPCQRGQGEGRQAVPCGVPQAAAAPLRPGLRKDARPIPQVRCVLSPWSVVLLVHLTLPGSGAGVLSPYLFLIRTSTVVECSCQSLGDRLLMPQ